MDPQKRHLFLKDFIYPPFNFNKGASGRIVGFGRSGANLRLTLDSGETASIKASSELSKGFPCGEVLIEGDIIWAGESKIRMLAPCLTESPPTHHLFDLERSAKWQSFMEWVRKYFRDREFIEVRTPSLVVSPGLEPFLDPFKTQFQLGKNKTDFFLPTSPEFHLKKMLTKGWKKIFEFKECFRNGELGNHHQPEFLMLEWYRSYVAMDSMIHDVKSLLGYLQDQFGSKVKFDEVDVTTMSELFKKHCKFVLKTSTTKQELESLCSKQGVIFDPNDSWDELFHRIFIEKIEPNLNGPVIVQDFPPSQAALARLTPTGWADRFELYWGGFEIANAFNELNDPREQRKRFDEFIDEKKRIKKEPVPIDEEFLTSLDQGMPPSVGIAMGMERLFLALLGESDLVGARAFPIVPQK